MLERRWAEDEKHSKPNKENAEQTIINQIYLSQQTILQKFWRQFRD